MNVNGYEIDEREIERWVKRNTLRRILVQAPDGLKSVALGVIDYLESLGMSALLSADHTWGGCDLALDEAKSVGADGIIHIGHHGPVWFKPPENPPILFIPAYSIVDPTHVFEKLLDELERNGVKSIGLATTIQHFTWLTSLKETARKRGFTVETGRYAGFEGLVVGCDYSSLGTGKSDAIVVVAGGSFHALGAAIWSGLPTWGLDPYTGVYRRVELKSVLASRLYALSRAMDASSFLLIVSVKPGQKRMEIAMRVKEALKRRGRKAIIAVFNDLSREKIENLGVFDAYINTACPRLVIDDPEIFPGPSLNIGELKYVLQGSLEGYSLRDSLFLDLRFLEDP
ncbi:MAG: diphthamide biosynthesis enzyme Dph2 [Infirmifilum sp.]